MIKTRIELKQAVQVAYDKLCGVLRELPPAVRQLRVMDTAGGKVSVADLVAYQIGWGKLLIGWYEAGMREEMPQMPGDGFDVWDYTAIARHFYSTYCHDGGEIQEREFAQVVARIVSIIAEADQEGTLNRLGVWPWCQLRSGKQWPLSKWIQVNTVAPYRRALTLIQNGVRLESFASVSSQR